MLTKLNKWILKNTGHNLEEIGSFNDFAVFMHRPMDAASLGACRMLFGILTNQFGRLIYK